MFSAGTEIKRRSRVVTLAAERQETWTTRAITKKDLPKIKKDLNNYVRIDK
jgi:hypothetical protein